MPRNTSLHIQDILDAIAKILAYIENVDFEEFESDSMRQDAVFVISRLLVRPPLTYQKISSKNILTFLGL